MVIERPVGGPGKGQLCALDVECGLTKRFIALFMGLLFEVVRRILCLSNNEEEEHSLLKKCRNVISRESRLVIELTARLTSRLECVSAQTLIQYPLSGKY